MALITRTYRVDDLDGSEEDIQTVFLALDGTSYEMDLSAANEARLRDSLAKFIDAGAAVKPRPVKRITKQQVTTPSSREQTAAVRGWANQNGFTVSERGRIPKRALAAFNEAH